MGLFNASTMPDSGDDERTALRRIALILNQAFGASGSKGGAIIGDTAAHSGEFGAIQALDDTEFGSVTGNIAGLSGSAISAGQIVYGSFTSITLVSGRVIAYNSN